MEDIGRQVFFGVHETQMDTRSCLAMKSVPDPTLAQIIPLFGLTEGGRELIVPIHFGADTFCLHVTRGPSLDEETILAWLDRDLSETCSALTIDAPLERCAVVRDGLHVRPCARLGDARFVIPEEFAVLLESEFGFASLIVDD
jgi:hypothetical protein